MTRPSDHYPRRCGCGHHAADPAINDHPISLRDDLDSFARGFAASLLKQKEDGLGEDRKVNVPLGLQLPEGIVALNEVDARNLRTLGEFLKLSKQRRSVHDDSSTDAARAGIPDAAPTVEADTPTRAGIGVEDATTPAPSTSDDIVSVSISLSGDRQLVELVAALVIGGVK